MKIGYTHDQSLNEQVVQGSDGRLNVSARADPRIYYRSRDEGQAYTLVYDDADASAGAFICYWQNLRTDGKHLVIASARFSSNTDGSFKLHFITGTVTGGSSLTPTNFNKTSPNDAPISSAKGNGPLGGLTSAAEVDHVGLKANTNIEINLKDAVRLGQNDAIAIEFEQGSANSRIFGSIFGFYE